MKQKIIILDTSVFVNPASSRAFGDSPTESLRNFLEAAATIEGVQFYMPPSIYAELMYFVEENKISKNLLMIIHKKAPKKHEIKVPGIFIHQLVHSMRDRVDRGLRLAERHVREALQMDPPARPEPGTKGIRPDGEMIGRLRESYRRIMREGMLDSKADVDLLLLAYETDGTLVSADQGVLEWAEEMGLSHLAYDQLENFLSENSSKKTR